MYRWIGALAAALALAACGGPTSVPGTPSATVVTPADLAALAERYGLPDCPETDPDAPAVDGGLPRTDLACLGSGTRVNLAGLPAHPQSSTSGPSGANRAARRPLSCARASRSSTA